MEDELKWMSPRKMWKYIPNRYQALVAQITAGLLYYQVFRSAFESQDSGGGACGSLFRPVIDNEEKSIGWFWNMGNAYCPRMMSGRQDELLMTFIGLAICGLVLRRAIKRMPSEHREATKFQ